MVLLCSRAADRSLALFKYQHKGDPRVALVHSRMSVVTFDFASVFLHARTVLFGVENALFQSAWSRASLSPRFFTLVLEGELSLFSNRFQAITQFHSSPVSIHDLGPFLLAAHFDAGGQVSENNGGRGFVDLLPAWAAASNEILLQVFIADSELAQAFLQRVFVRQRHVWRVEG